MRETGGFELASTITLVLQAKRLTKCASHPDTRTTYTRTLFSSAFMNNQYYMRNVFSESFDKKDLSPIFKISVKKNLAQS